SHCGPRRTGVWSADQAFALPRSAPLTHTQGNRPGAATRPPSGPAALRAGRGVAATVRGSSATWVVRRLRAPARGSPAAGEGRDAGGARRASAGRVPVVTHADGDVGQLWVDYRNSPTVELR